MMVNQTKRIANDYERKIALSVLQNTAPVETLKEMKYTSTRLPEILAEIQFFHDLPKKNGTCPDDPSCITTIVKQRDFINYRTAVEQLVKFSQKEQEYNRKFFEILDKSTRGFCDALIETERLTSANLDLQTENAQLKQTIIKISEALKIQDQQTAALTAKFVELNQKIDAFKNQPTTQENHTLTEACNRVQTITENLRDLRDEVATLQLHVKPRFKAKLQIQNTEPNYTNPYSYGGN